MGTKGTKSSGSQFNPKGITQGVTLVDPNTGNPIDVRTDTHGTRRLAVDANITVDDITVETRPLTAATDAVRLEDPNTGAHVRVELDGSINVNAFSNAFGPVPDSELIVGTEDGTTTGTKHVVKVNPDGSLAVAFSGGQATTPQIFNITVPLANTEVSQALPANVKRFLIKVRGYKSKLKLSYTAGQSGTNYIEVSLGNSYGEEGINVPSLTTYFQTDKANQIVEILAWS